MRARCSQLQINESPCIRMNISQIYFESKKRKLFENSDAYCKVIVLNNSMNLSFFFFSIDDVTEQRKIKICHFVHHTAYLNRQFFNTK